MIWFIGKSRNSQQVTAVCFWRFCGYGVGASPSAGGGVCWEYEKTTPSPFLLHAASQKVRPRPCPLLLRPHFSPSSLKLLIKMDRKSASQSRDKTYVFLWTSRQFQVEWCFWFCLSSVCFSLWYQSEFVVCADVCSRSRRSGTQWTACCSTTALNPSVSQIPPRTRTWQVFIYSHTVHWW